ncbi:hypothetical protein KR093_009364, partial [Drosophila rubida]
MTLGAAAAVAAGSSGGYLDAPLPAKPPIYGTMIPNRIFVGGISRDTSEYDLMFAFSAYGTVRSTKIICDHEGNNKGYGFVTFETEEEARRLQAAAKSVTLNNRRLNIAPAIKKQQVRPVLQRFVDASGRFFFAATGMPHSPAAQLAAASMQQATAAGAGAGATATGDFGNGGGVPPALYPSGMQYQPIYHYFTVPVNVNVPTIWHPSY